MLSKLFEYVKQIFDIKQKLDKHTEEIKEMKVEIKLLQNAFENSNSTIMMLVREIQHDREKSESEREIILLRLENRLLKFEHRLPPSEAGE